MVLDLDLCCVFGDRLGNQRGGVQKAALYEAKHE